MGKKLDVGLDVDGVLYDFIAAMREWYAMTQGIRAKDMPVPDQWHIAECWPHLAGDTDRFHADCKEALLAGHLTVWGDPLPGVQELLYHLIGNGHRVHIITAREFGCGEAYNLALTGHWFTHNLLPYTTLTISHDKTVVPTDVFLDDKPSNVDALLAAGTVAICRTQPWNTYRTDLPRMEDLQQFAHLVDAVSLLSSYQPLQDTA